MSVYLIRHGQSEFNAVHKEGDPDPMIFDARLTELGVSQANAARQMVQDLGIELVIASPLTRAIQTALHIFGEQCQLKIMPGARELLTHCCDVGRAPGALKADFPHLSFGHLEEEWWHRGPKNANGISVEPKEIFQNRIKAFAEELEAIQQRPVAVVAHANMIRELSGFDMANCEVRRFVQ